MFLSATWFDYPWVDSHLLFTVTSDIDRQKSTDPHNLSVFSLNFEHSFVLIILRYD